VFVVEGPHQEGPCQDLAVPLKNRRLDVPAIGAAERLLGAEPLEHVNAVAVLHPVRGVVVCPSRQTDRCKRGWSGSLVSGLNVQGRTSNLSP
jgi:hypothetical protein